MKHVTTADKSLLIGDEAAELIIEYAALLGQRQTADEVRLQAYGADGDPVEVIFLLNSGTTLMVESSESVVPEPDNADAIEYIRDRMQMLTSPPNVQPMDADVRASEWDG
jgi:hypothetical protein